MLRISTGQLKTLVQGKGGVCKGMLYVLPVVFGIYSPDGYYKWRGNDTYF